MKDWSAYRRFAVGAVAAALALGALSAHVVAENTARTKALADALYHEDTRAALWQMEMRVAAMLGAITYEERTPITEPQILVCGLDPYSNRIDVREPGASVVPPAARDAADEAFKGATPLAAAEVDPAPQSLSSWTDTIAQRGAQRSQDDLIRRFGANAANLSQQVQTYGVMSTQVTVGPLTPFWSDLDGDLSLCLTRRVDRGEARTYETFVVDWPLLEDVLQEAMEGLLPRACLSPIRTAADDRGDAMRLASVPVRLDAEKPDYAASMTRAYLLPLGGAWLGLVVALLAAWTALRASIAQGERHRRFTQAVTHELRTPLTTFRMYSEMLRMGMVPEGARDEYLAALEGESQRLVGLVDNVLRYARLEEGRALPDRRAVQVAEICDAVVAASRGAVARAGARVEVALEGGTALGERVLVTDPDAVQQILGNLVDNALKYGAADEDTPASVTLAACEGAGGALRFEVRDEGPGIIGSQRASIFQPFDRAGRDSSDPAPGVGLGLALARRLAEQLGGRLELLDSGPGARFRLTLPGGAPVA